jgi:hypothetical protein
MDYLVEGAFITDFNPAQMQRKPGPTMVYVEADLIRADRPNIDGGAVSFCYLPQDPAAPITYSFNTDCGFLPYAAGSITHCFSAGRDVLSGPFSGCIMARYKLNGVYHVCHVAMDDLNRAGVMKHWQEIKKTSEDKVIDFKPHRVVGCELNLGLITNDGACFAIGCKKDWVKVKETRSWQQIFDEEMRKIKTDPRDQRSAVEKQQAIDDKKRLAQIMAANEYNRQALKVVKRVKVRV